MATCTAKEHRKHTNRAAGPSFSSRFLLLLFSLLASEGLQLWLKERRVKGTCDRVGEKESEIWKWGTVTTGNRNGWEQKKEKNEEESEG